MDPKTIALSALLCISEMLPFLAKLYPSINFYGVLDFVKVVLVYLFTKVCRNSQLANEVQALKLPVPSPSGPAVPTQAVHSITMADAMHA